jgi:recombination DNA repair RAD52 pathway protein
MSTEMVQVTAADLSLVEQNSLNAKQLKLLLKKTPKQYVHTRPAKGGGQWEYVSGGYVKKVLNLMFGWDWDFEIMSEQILHNEAIVKGKLTCRINGRTIVKMQYGNKDIICKKGTDTPLSIGNDLKAAATDALKKCAAELGVAADIYNKLDFKEINVKVESIEEINDSKEANRIIDYIGTCTSALQLQSVESAAMHYGLVDIYTNKLKELQNG